MEIREALESAVEEHSNDAPEVTAVETPAADAAPSPVPSDTPVESASPDKPEPEAKPEGKKVESAPEKPVAQSPEQQRAQHRVDRAPQSWKKEAKGEWNALPLHVRQEVYKREMEVEKVLKETAPLREQIQEIQSVVSPFMARIQAAGVTPVQAMHELFKADFVLATGTPQSKAQMLAKLVNDYGVSIEDLDAAIVASIQGRQQQQQPQGFDPNYVNQLVQQQLQQALAPIYQERQQREQAVVQQAAQTVEQMALNPQFPYFEDVRQEMADLIEVSSKRGVVLSLEDAYTKAVAINPDISGQQSRQATMTQANQQHQQAQRAKLAASSVNGAPASGGSQSFAGDGSMRGAIEAAFNNARI